MRPRLLVLELNVEKGYEAFALKLPEDPLTVTTVVMEMDDGRLVPMVSDKE